MSKERAGTTLVGGEAQPQHAHPVLGPPLDARQVGVVEADCSPPAGGDRRRQPRLADHRRQDRRLDGHGKRKAAGETQANGADAGAAALAVRLGRQRSQPGGDRTGAVGEDDELARHETRTIARSVTAAASGSPGRPNSDGRKTVYSWRRAAGRARPRHPNEVRTARARRILGTCSAR
jgi:hypothetical protein